MGWGFAVHSSYLYLLYLFMVFGYPSVIPFLSFLDISFLLIVVVVITCHSSSFLFIVVVVITCHSSSFLAILYYSLQFFIIPCLFLSLLFIPCHSLWFPAIPHKLLSFLVIPYSQFIHPPSINTCVLATHRTMDRWKATKTYRPDYQTADGGPQLSLEVSDILLHGGLDSSRHVCC